MDNGTSKWRHLAMWTFVGLIVLAVQCSHLFPISCCRTAFEELVMDNGTLKWQHLETWLCSAPTSSLRHAAELLLRRW